MPHDSLRFDIQNLQEISITACNVKPNHNETDEVALPLLALQDKVDTDRMGRPTFLMVLSGEELAYRRQDGVFIVPLACLKD